MDSGDGPEGRGPGEEDVSPLEVGGENLFAPLPVVDTRADQWGAFATQLHEWTLPAYAATFAGLVGGFFIVASRPWQELTRDPLLEWRVAPLYPGFLCAVLATALQVSASYFDRKAVRAREGDVGK